MVRSGLGYAGNIVTYLTGIPAGPSSKDLVHQKLYSPGKLIHITIENTGAIKADHCVNSFVRLSIPGVAPLVAHRFPALLSVET